jgi:hypothetical protein
VSVGAFSFGDAKGVAESSAVELQLMEDSQCGTLHLFALLNCGRCYIYICTAVAWYTSLPSEGLGVEAVWLFRPAGSPLAVVLRPCITCTRCGLGPVVVFCLFYF